MITDIFDEVHLKYEGYVFQQELKNQLLQQTNYSENQGYWEYNGEWYHTQIDLYTAILAHEIAYFFNIESVTELIAIFTNTTPTPTKVVCFKNRNNTLSPAYIYVSNRKASYSFGFPFKDTYNEKKYVYFKKPLSFKIVKIISFLTKNPQLIKEFLNTDSMEYNGYELDHIFYRTQDVYDLIIEG